MTVEEFTKKFRSADTTGKTPCAEHRHCFQPCFVCAAWAVAAEADAA